MKIFARRATSGKACLVAAQGNGRRPPKPSLCLAEPVLGGSAAGFLRARSAVEGQLAIGATGRALWPASATDFPSDVGPARGRAVPPAPVACPFPRAAATALVGEVEGAAPSSPSTLVPCLVDPPPTERSQQGCVNEVREGGRGWVEGSAAGR